MPQALVDNGQRWHVCAYDRDDALFSDFVIARIAKAKILERAPPENAEEAKADKQCNPMVELVLVPHPKFKHKAAIEADWMKAGKLRVACRAAVAGYALRRWGVDCSSEHALSETEYQLSIRNLEALRDIESALLAPGTPSYPDKRN